jgi:hypothetical protein
MKRWFTFLIVLLLCEGHTYAQQPTVEARVTPDSIGIGDLFTLEIEVERDQVQRAEFPEFENNRDLELVESLPVDTLHQEGRRLKLRKRYRLQAFSEGRLNLGRPGVLYLDKNIVDTLYVADTLFLEVGTFDIDTAKQTINDIKSQRNLPFKFREISGYLSLTFGILLLLLGAFYLLHRYLAKRGKRISDLFKPAPPLPPHVVAIQALEQLHNQKLWQNNKHKLYYSGLTDILRCYLVGRFGVSAMEMTSDEILESLHPLNLPSKSIMELRSLLQEADLVKFAKALPEATTNEDAYQWAYYFVEETKPIEESQPVDAEAIAVNFKDEHHA